MGSTFSGIEVGKRGLSTHQQALHTTGHNIANADNKSYSRQRVGMSAAESIYDPSLNRPLVAGQIGQGSIVSHIERIRDQFIDERVIETSTEKNYWAARQEYLHQAEIIFGEPAGNTIRSSLDELWSSFEEMGNYPDESAHRSVVKEKANTLASRLENTYSKLASLKDQANREFEAKSNQLINLSETVRVLNEKINKSESLGDSPNDLYDKRDKAIEELSALVDITVGRSDKDEFMVFIGQQILVQGSKKSDLKLVPDAERDGKLDLYWKESNSRVLMKSGRLQGLLEIRDDIITDKINQVDSLSVNIIDTVNSIHKDGFGLNGKTNINFFDVKSLANNIYGEYDSNGDGLNDMTAIFRVNGKTSLDADRPIGLSGTMTFHKNDGKSTPVYVAYSQDDTVGEVIKRINNSRAGIVASLNHDNQLTLKATISEDHPKQNFIIQHLEDSGQFLVGLSGILAGSGAAGSFDYQRVGEYRKFQANPEDITLTPYYNPSGRIKLSEEVNNNVMSIAASRGKAIGGATDYNSGNGAKDGQNALLIARALRDKPIMVEYDTTVNSFYAGLISHLGTEAAEAIQELEVRTAVLTEYENLRQSTMGVSLDEEMANMVQFQQSYNAAAKMINVQNDMLDTIINRLGVGR
jgi:flagellar hook-associated protein 1